MFVETDNKKIMTDLHEMGSEVLKWTVMSTLALFNIGLTVHLSLPSALFSNSFLIKDMSVYNVLILYNTQ
jgi:hypothetical protein